MLKRYRMYYSEAAGKIEMYLLCQKYHMSGCVQYEPTNEMMVELYGEERKIDNFMPILEKYFNRKPCKVIGSGPTNVYTNGERCRVSV